MQRKDRTKKNGDCKLGLLSHGSKRNTNKEPDLTDTETEDCSHDGLEAKQSGEKFHQKIFSASARKLIVRF